jgi:hypothetical protein
MTKAILQLEINLVLSIFVFVSSAKKPFNWSWEKQIGSTRKFTPKI